MECSWIRTSLVAFILYVGCVCSMKTFYPQNIISELRKIAVDSSGRDIYVGGKNILYHLNADLTEVIGVVETGPQKDSKRCLKEFVDKGLDTCEIKKYDDYIQLLQVHESGGILVMCSTLYLGRCVGRDLQNISNVNYTSLAYYVVNTEETDSTEGVIANIETQPLLFVGKSVFETSSDYEELRYLINGGQLVGDTFMNKFQTQTGFLPFVIKIIKTSDDYGFFVKGVFYMNNSTSVYTLIQIRTQAQKNVSKISKMCAKDNGGRTTYEDIPIECDGFPYVQGGTVIQHGQGEVLVTLFSLFENVTETTSCAVCVYTEEELLEGFKKSRMSSPACGNPMNYPVHYLANENTGNCLNCTEKNNEDLCMEKNKTFYCDRYGKKSVGVIPLGKSPLFHDQGLTSVGGSFRNDLTTIMVGTITGIFHKLYLKSANTDLRMLRSNKLQPLPIMDIVTTKQYRTYLLNKYSVNLMEDQGECSGTNCSECMKIADSKCGWCVLNGGGCMEKNGCEKDFWLPSVAGECLTVHTHPPGIRHGYQTIKQNISVSLHPAVPITGTNWQCQFSPTDCKPGRSPCLVDLIISNTGQMICELEVKAAFQKQHKLADFKILQKSPPNKTLVEGWSMLFFACDAFKSCYECVNNSKVGELCTWDPEEATCVDSSGMVEGYISKNESERCPRLSETQIKLPYDKLTTVSIPAENLPSENKELYSCNISDVKCTILNVSKTLITCQVQISQKGVGMVNVSYGSNGARIDNPGDVSTVKVSKCENLTKSCSTCIYLNMQGYECNWDYNNEKCSYSTSKDVNTTRCPHPTITRVYPINGTTSGNTLLTIEGKEFGANRNDVNITVMGRPCEIYKESFFPNNWLKCYTRNITTEHKGAQILVTRNNKQSINSKAFHYLVPKLHTVSPSKGIKSGGRVLTLKGKNLLTGNLEHMTIVLSNAVGNVPCKIVINPSVQNDPNTIKCFMREYTGSILPNQLTDITVTFDDFAVNLTAKVNFEVLDNPIIRIPQTNAIKEGGVIMDITGERFEAVTLIKIEQASRCKVINDSRMKCFVPKYKSTLGKRRRRSADTCPCNQILTLHMDNYEYPFRLVFTENPTIIPFSDSVQYQEGSYIEIEGRDLLQGAVESDYQVLVQSAKCDEVKVNANGTVITFKPPDFLSKGNEYHVEVLVGSFQKDVGVIYYVKDLKVIIIIAALGGMVLAMLSVIAYCIIRVRKKESQLSKLQNDMVEMESNIRSKSREVFADMQMSMQDIKGDLVTTGIPYFNYHNYSFHTLFPKLKAGESIYFQTSAERPMEDFSKLAPRGILAFEELLKNKFFLQSLICTLERQNKFSVQEKAEFSSLLTLTLIGKMTYLSEVIEELLHRLIAGATRKQHRVLFRRSDSITQKLLYDWMALSLFPYLKSGGGQQLFMLYKATQTVMEKGPIDAVTLDAKETLAEERLLKMDVPYESLTLEVDLNGKRHLRYQVPVLDCDTITQVKAKCMYKIYKNKPATELQFTPEELILEWHAGKGGKLVLNDIDRTSTKREGYVCRNTLRHYNVKDGSCMALLISDEPDEPYMNSESASMSDVLLSEHSVTSYMSMSPEKQWHISFPEEDEKERTQVYIEELYLNRLLHTKLKLVDYINAVFDNVLDENRVPPVVCYLFNMLENMAKEQNVCQDIVSCWKSECYAMRIWSLWISSPDLLFDIILAKHVIPCLDVIKSVFSDVFSRNSSKLTKDSSSAKLLFASEVPKFQEKMRKFYDKLGTSLEPVTKQQFRSQMESISQEQTQKIRVKKLPALKKLFSVVKKYSDEIISDLDEDKETRDLELGQKFDNVIQQMDMENM